jgi:multiple sugar transport system permease protein
MSAVRGGTRPRRLGLDPTIWRTLRSLALCVPFLFPVYWMFSVSLKPPEDIFHVPPVWYPSEPQFGNFWVLFKDGDVTSVLNSLIIATTSTAIAMVFGTMCAYSIARFRTGGDNLAIWILSQRMLPPVAVVFPVFLVYAFLGWSDTYIGMIVLYTAFGLPYVIWMMRGYIEDIPKELEECALIDGCTRWQVLLKVVLPMARTGLFATAVFAFIFSWNEFLFALVLTRTEITTYPVQVTHYFGAQGVLWAKVSAMSVLGTLPVFFVVATMQRFLVRGMSMGAIKG